MDGHVCNMARGSRANKLVVVRGRYCHAWREGHVDVAGNVSAQAVQLQRQWLCGTVVVPNSVDTLPLDVKVYV